MKYLGLILTVGMVIGLGACNENAARTCDDLDNFLATCYPQCAASLDCEPSYELLDPESQELLDECAECLDDNAFLGTCADCNVEAPGVIFSCFDLLIRDLDTICGWQ